MKKLQAPKKPSQVIVETKEGFYIDNFSLDFVLEDGVTVQELGEDYVRVNVTFIAKSYEFRFKE